MASETKRDTTLLAAALAHAGRGERLRARVFEALREEEAFLLSPSARPDHVWEPQTTRLLAALGVRTCCTVA